MLSIFDCVEYSEDSSTFLKLTIDNFSPLKNRVYARKGDSIGCFRKRADGEPKCVDFIYHGKKYLVHNIVYEIFNGFKSGTIVDHIDGNPWNNNPSNLRDVSLAINARNVRKSKRNNTGVVGVSKTSASNGKYWYYEAFVSCLLTGKLIRKKFSINFLGEVEAFRLACTWRESQMNILNTNGAGYTDRHGK